MSKIKLSKGEFTPISEGQHIFKITGSTYKEDFGRLEIKLTTAEGAKHTEKYFLLNDNREINEGAQRAFSFLAKTALNNFNLEEVDPEDLVGCYVEARVTHDKVPSQKDPAQTMTFIHLRDMKPASGFENQNGATPAEEEETEEPATNDFDLDDLLG